MASVTGMTAAAIAELISNLVVSVEIDANGQIIYTRKSGEQINAGSVINPTAATSKSWPVGSIFISTVPTNPATLLGIGTWARFGKGRTLVSLDEAQEEFNTAQEEGGEKSVSLTTANLPEHNHSINHDHAAFASELAGNHNHSFTVVWRDDLSDVAGNKKAITGIGGVQQGDADGSAQGDTFFGSTNHQHTVNVPAFIGTSGDAGGGTPHNNLPPYIVVYMWKRTA